MRGVAVSWEHGAPARRTAGRFRNFGGTGRLPCLAMTLPLPYSSRLGDRKESKGSYQAGEAYNGRECGAGASTLPENGCLRREPSWCSAFLGDGEPPHPSRCDAGGGATQLRGAFRFPMCFGPVENPTFVPPVANFPNSSILWTALNHRCCCLSPVGAQALGQIVDC
jgi:hypothetical protein